MAGNGPEVVNMQNDRLMQAHALRAMHQRTTDGHVVNLADERRTWRNFKACTHGNAHAGVLPAFPAVFLAACVAHWAPPQDRPFAGGISQICRQNAPYSSTTG